jgi:repressor LexA
MNDNKIFLASNLKHLRILNKKTQEEVGEICNKTNTAVSNWEKGIREPDAVDLFTLSNYFNISIDDLMAKDLRFDNAEIIDISSDTIQIPVLGTIKAGVAIEAQEDIIEYVDIPKEWTKGNKQYYGLQISGDSMFPKYQEKDIVIFLQTNDYESANKKDCAVMVNGFDATFKNITITDGGITLVPLNINNSDNYQPTFYSKEQIEQLPVKIIGIAVEKRTRL